MKIKPEHYSTLKKAANVAAAAYDFAELEQHRISTVEADAREFMKYEAEQWHDADARDRHIARSK